MKSSNQLEHYLIDSLIRRFLHLNAFLLLWSHEILNRIHVFVCSPFLYRQLLFSSLQSNMWNSMLYTRIINNLNKVFYQVMCYTCRVSVTVIVGFNTSVRVLNKSLKAVGLKSFTHIPLRCEIPEPDWIFRSRLACTIALLVVRIFFALNPWKSKSANSFFRNKQ